MDIKLKYDEIFRKAFDLENTAFLEDADILSIDNWTSIEHITFVTMLEEAFGIKLSNDDIFQSYRYGLQLLKRLGILE